MFRIAICDDDVQFTGFLENQILKESLKIATKVSIEVFFDGLTLSQSVVEGNRYDLIFLDIEIKRLNGIDTARQIREFDKTVLIIYISSYEQNIKELFEVETFRFLTKPLNKKQFSLYFLEA